MKTSRGIKLIYKIATIHKSRKHKRADCWDFESVRFWRFVRMLHQMKGETTKQQQQNFAMAGIQKPPYREKETSSPSEN